MSKNGKMVKEKYRLVLDRESIIYLAVIVLLVLIKHQIASGLPISPRPSYKTDDRLMVNMAASILQGRWLGQYSYGMLMKGSFYPMFLAGLYWLGLNYLAALDILNALAALYFVHCVKPLLPGKGRRLVLFAVLLFNPATLSHFTFERIYRNSISIMQVLFLFGTWFGLFLYPEKKRWKQVIMLLFEGFVLWGFWNTREDAMWAAPFVFAAMILVIISGMMRTAAADRRRFWTELGKRTLLCLIPLFMLFAGNRIIAGLNKAYYGKAIRLETESAFGDLIKTMYSIRNEEDREWTTVTHEKLERFYEVSPTLMSIRPELEDQVKNADQYDGLEADGDVEDGWFYWSLRKAAENAGKADTLLNAEKFYQAVHDELNAEINKPDSSFELQAVMPSPLMSPWRKGYLKKLIPNIGKAALYMASFSEITAEPRIIDTELVPQARLFEGLTNDSFIWSPSSEGKPDILVEFKDLYIKRADRVTAVYQALNVIPAAASVLLFVILTVIVLIRKKWNHLPFVLVTAGLILSILVMLTGIAYTEMTAFRGIVYTYLSGGYPLMLAFEWIVILYAVNLIKERKKNG